MRLGQGTAGVEEWRCEEWKKWFACRFFGGREQEDHVLGFRNVNYVSHVPHSLSLSLLLSFLSLSLCVQEDIGKLLRFESSALPAGQQTNLKEYGSRMKAGTRNIYYLCAPNRHLAEHSPYFEAMKQKDMEVSCFQMACYQICWLAC